jgi:hypothetical protein
MYSLRMNGSCLTGDRGGAMVGSMRPLRQLVDCRTCLPRLHLSAPRRHPRVFKNLGRGVF